MSPVLGKVLENQAFFGFCFSFVFNIPPAYPSKFRGMLVWVLKNISAGVLELVDEADSKSVGLITRAGSTPATGTIFAPKCHASEHFLLPRSKDLNIFRKRRENCICRRNLTGKIQMCVNIGSSADVTMPQPFLNFFQAHTIGIE